MPRQGAPAGRDAHAIWQASLLFLRYRSVLASVMLAAQVTRARGWGAGVLFAIVWSKKCLSVLGGLLVVALTTMPAAIAESTWLPPQFVLQQGTLSDAETLVADAAGGVAFSVLTDGQLLEENPLLTLTLAGAPPARVMIYWRTSTTDGRFAQVEVAPPVEGTSAYNLKTVSGWHGAVEVLGFALQGTPYQSINVRSVVLARPALSEILQTYWHQWAGPQQWTASDINLLTGTRAADAPLYPMPVFAGLTALALVLFVFGSLLWRRAQPINWHIVGAIILCIWIVSDTLWQARLWHQVGQTWATFGGKTAQQKLLASEDAPVVVLATEAQRRIKEADARVFIASSMDVVGMLSAYYMAPLNTFWHRGGPELPRGDPFEAGDYILMIRPSQVDYDARAGIVRRIGETAVQVHQVYANDTGVLLKVI